MLRNSGSKAKDAAPCIVVYHTLDDLQDGGIDSQQRKGRVE